MPRGVVFLSADPGQSRNRSVGIQGAGTQVIATASIGPPTQPPGLLLNFAIGAYRRGTVLPPIPSVRA
jgi:hypothetical protein